MVYRLCKLPLSITNYMQELENIKRIANINGYTNEEIDELAKKYWRRIKKMNTSTLFSQNKSPKNKITSFKFNHTITNYIKPILKKQDIDMVFSSNNKVKDILGNPKDKLEEHQKSGIYKIQCSQCPKIYIGQTKRDILTRYKEHCSHIKFNRPSKSAVAEHVLTENHFNITIENLKLAKQTQKTIELDVIESMQIHKNKKHLMNNVYGPISSSLFNFIKTKDTL